MRYKHHLLVRGAKHFNPYEKRMIHSHSHHHSHHHSGGALITDHELLSILSLHHRKPRTARRGRKSGGSVKTRPYKPLVFTR